MPVRFHLAAEQDEKTLGKKKNWRSHESKPDVHRFYPRCVAVLHVQNGRRGRKWSAVGPSLVELCRAKVPLVFVQSLMTCSPWLCLLDAIVAIVR